MSTKIGIYGYGNLAKGVECVSSQHLDETEELTIHLFTREQLLEMLRADQLKQALMVAPLWRYIAENHLL